jgi:dynein heavy chain, axonemal
LLSQSVRDIFDDFMRSMEKWQHIDYDIIDVDAAARFGPDFRAFRGVIKELERRLCQVVMAAFDDCATMGSTFKLLDSFEGLLDREVIAQVLYLQVLASEAHVPCTVQACYSP